MQIEKGFRGKLSSYLDASQPFTVEVSVSGPSDYEAGCWFIDDSGATSERSITLPVNLAEFPESTAHILFTLNISGTGTMRSA